MDRSRIAPSIAFVCIAVVSSAPAQAEPRQAEPRAVIELFTSQGCSSCPPADKLIGEYARDPSVIALSLAVDYWDYLGWKDTHAESAFAERQKAYKQRLGWKDVYTPQAVVNGRVQVQASDPRRLTRLLSETPDIATSRVTFDRSGERAFVRGGTIPPGGAEVWMVRYDPGLNITKVTAGENEGVMVVRRNTVRELVRLGPYTGRPRAYGLPRPETRGLRTVVIVQALRRSGVIGAGRDSDVEHDSAVLKTAPEE